MYNLIFGKRKKFEINNADVTYKVHYLGNVMTSIMKGDGCVDRPVGILWDNHLKCNGKAGIKMNLTLTQGGIRVDTKASGITEYYGHRIHYTIAHPLHPKLFVWVYQHVGKNLKTEIRCHAVLCKKSTHAKLIAFLLNEKKEHTFNEYKREKRRMQNSRLCNNKFKKMGMPQRKISLRSTNKYKPPINTGMFSAPKLDDVDEEEEDEYNDNEVELNQLVDQDVDENDDEEEEESIENNTDNEEYLVLSTDNYDNNKVELNCNDNIKINDDNLSVYNSITDSGIDESFTQFDLIKQDNNNNTNINTKIIKKEIDVDMNIVNNELYNKVSYDFLDDLSKLNINQDNTGDEESTLKVAFNKIKSSSFRIKSVFNNNLEAIDSNLLVNIAKKKSSSFSVRRNNSLNKNDKTDNKNFHHNIIENNSLINNNLETISTIS